MARAVPLRIGPQGRVVIPAELRRELGLEPGETLMARVDSGRLVLERRGEILSRLRSELREATPPGTSMVDELIAERRAEARREAAEDERRA
jgi:AbrB family looped-hinge helix DNA binding protein